VFAGDRRRIAFGRRRCGNPGGEKHRKFVAKLRGEAEEVST
jgi:hypothetical protein